MNIAATQVSLDTSSFEIYIAGCDGYCDKLNKKFIDEGINQARCHNHNIWDFNVGHKFNKKYIESIEDKINQFDGLIDYICIMGGEPLLQPVDELYDMLKSLRFLNKKIILFTRFYYVSSYISSMCDYVKMGPYDYSKRGENKQMGFELASTNQRIEKV